MKVVYALVATATLLAPQSEVANSPGKLESNLATSLSALQDKECELYPDIPLEREYFDCLSLFSEYTNVLGELFMGEQTREASVHRMESLWENESGDPVIGHPLIRSSLAYYLGQFSRRSEKDAQLGEFREYVILYSMSGDKYIARSAISALQYVGKDVDLLLLKEFAKREDDLSKSAIIAIAGILSHDPERLKMTLAELLGVLNKEDLRALLEKYIKNPPHDSVV